MGGGHGEVLKKTRWHSIDEIPDELVQKYSKRDPENMLYRTRRWVNFKKKQILFQQPDGVPDYLRTRPARFVYYGIWISAFTLCFANIWTFNKYSNQKK